MSVVHDSEAPASPRPLIDAQALQRLAEEAWRRADRLPAAPGQAPGNAPVSPWCEVRTSVDSTNRVLMEAPFGADGRVAAPRLLVALEQTAGRGRRGRNWVSPPGSGLTFSVALEKQGGLPVAGAWSLWVGLTLAEVLSPWVPDLALKWPNDLQRSGRKCGGILCETRRQAGNQGLDRVVIGIGLNLLPDPGRDNLDQPVAALFEAALPVSREALLAEVLAALGRRWEGLAAGSLVDLDRRWAAFDALIAQSIVVLDQGRVVLEGTAEGVDADGALRLRVGDEIRSLSFGEVSVRTRAAHAGGR